MHWVRYAFDGFCACGAMLLTWTDGLGDAWFGHESLEQEFKGYVFKIMGGCDKQGFPMKQGVLIPGRASLLMHRGTCSLQCTHCHTHAQY